MARLRVTFDPKADAAYVYFREIEPGGAAIQCPVVCNRSQGMIVLDLDLEGRLIGVEVIGARGGLPPELLDQAETPPISSPGSAELGR
jgi:uncharacterized protein YuzE